MDTITRINGNGRPYTTDLPKLVILADEINGKALDHVEANTGLKFTKTHWRGYEAQPTESRQIAALFMTYNFKSRYFNNSDYSNTLMLKFDHHVGFDVDSICLDCVKANHIHVGDLSPDSRLSC